MIYTCMERFLCVLQHSIAMTFKFTVIQECPSLLNYKIRCPSVDKKQRQFWNRVCTLLLISSTNPGIAWKLVHYMPKVRHYLYSRQYIPVWITISIDFVKRQNQISIFCHHTLRYMLTSFYLEGKIHSIFHDTAFLLGPQHYLISEDGIGQMTLFTFSAHNAEVR